MNLGSPRCPSFRVSGMSTHLKGVPMAERRTSTALSPSMTWRPTPFVSSSRVVGEPAALVGWSHGGIVGLLVAIARPDLVSKLVVIGTSFDTKGMVFDVDDMVAGMSHDSFEMTMMRETYSAVSPDGADHWPTVFQKITTMWTREPHIPIDDLKKLAVPVLVLVGDDDMVSLSHSVELYEALPNAALGVIPFSSHTVLMEKPDIVNPMIVDFLKNDPVPTMMPIRRQIPDS